MVSVSATLLLLALSAPQGPRISNFDKALVLAKVRAAGFKAPQIRALHDGSLSVRAASRERNERIAQLALKDAELEELVKALAAGKAAADADQAKLDATVKQRELASAQWNQRVEDAVSKVIGTIPAREQYALGFPPEIRQQVDETLSQLRTLQGKEWEQLASEVTWALAADQFTQSLKANSGGSDRGASQDKRDLSRSIGDQKQEVARQGREFLLNLVRGNQNVDNFKQQLAASYVKGSADGNLRKLVREILTARSAVEALADAVAGG